MKSMMLVLLGLTAGVLSGLIGIGGGIILIPALILFFGFSQHLAQGTTLAAMIPPIGLLATYVYYKHGDVDVISAALIACGFFVGGFVGAKMAVHVNTIVLGRIFGVTLILIGIKMLVGK